MSKKQQPQAKEVQKNKAQIVDEQNEPFLKSLQKRVRNINKKLTEIAQLELKDSLKPEQVEKLNRKDALLEERTKIEETATHYKEALAENAEHYRNIQLKELEVLARALAVYHSAPDFPEHPRLAKLWTALAQNATGSTLNQTAASTANILKEFANDRKLQKALTTYVADNGDKLQEEPEVEEPQLETVVVEEDTVVVVIEEFKNEKGETETVEVIDRIHNGVEEITVLTYTEEPQPTVAVEDKVSEVVQETTPAPPAQEAKETAPAPAPAATTEAATEGQRQDRPYKGKGPYKPREPREPREDNRGERRGDGNRRRYNDGEKRVYKPKYQERAEEKEEAGSSSSSSPETRNFRKEEIRQLEDEGFIVVGKPKPKAKDQQSVYDHQHGKKYQRPPQEKKV